MRLALLLFLCVFATPASFAQSPPKRSLLETLRTDGNLPVMPFRIVGNIFYVGASDIASYLIVTPEGHILIDTGFESTVPLIRKNVETLGFKVQDIKIILSGHAHIDHVEGHALMKEVTGAQIIAMEGDAESIERGVSPDMPTYKWKPARVDRMIHDGDTVSLGSTFLHAYRTGGHTRGNTTWTTTLTDKGDAYNVVIVGSTTVNDGVRLLNNPEYPDIRSDYEASFRLLKSLHPDVFLGPHGRFFHLTEKRRLVGTGFNPFFDPYGYPASIQQSEEAFQKELARQMGKQ
jgi:metallo-beta-lactamase class B